MSRDEMREKGMIQEVVGEDCGPVMGVAEGWRRRVVGQPG